MSPEGNLSGFYPCSVDDKGRIALPGELRKEMEALYGGRDFYINTHKSYECLNAFGLPRLEHYNQIHRDHEARLFEEQGIEHDGKSQDKFVHFYAGLVNYKFDSSGRFVLNVNHRLLADIEDEAIIYATLDEFRIWSPENLLNAPDEPELRLVKKIYRKKLSKMTGGK